MQFPPIRFLTRSSPGQVKMPSRLLVEHLLAVYQLPSSVLLFPKPLELLAILWQLSDLVQLTAGVLAVVGVPVPGLFKVLRLRPVLLTGAVLHHVSGHARNTLLVRLEAVSIGPTVHDRLPFLCAFDLPPQTFHGITV